MNDISWHLSVVMTRLEFAGEKWGHGLSPDETVKNLQRPGTSAEGILHCCLGLRELHWSLMLVGLQGLLVHQLAARMPRVKAVTLIQEDSQGCLRLCAM